MKIKKEKFRDFKTNRYVFLNFGPEDDAPTEALSEEIANDPTGGQEETKSIEEAKKIAEKEGNKTKDVIVEIAQKEVEKIKSTEEEKRAKEKSDEREKACLSILESKNPPLNLGEAIGIINGKNKIFSNIEGATLKIQKLALLTYLNPKLKEIGSLIDIIPTRMSDDVPLLPQLIFQINGDKKEYEIRDFGNGSFDVSCTTGETQFKHRFNGTLEGFIDSIKKTNQVFSFSKVTVLHPTDTEQKAK